MGAKWRGVAPTGDLQPLQVMIDDGRPALVLEISAWGAWVELSSALRPLTVHTLTLPTTAGPLRVRVEVLHCRAASVVAVNGQQLVYQACLDFFGLEEQEVHDLIAAYGTAPLQGMQSVRAGGRQALPQAM